MVIFSIQDGQDVIGETAADHPVQERKSEKERIAGMNLDLLLKRMLTVGVIAFCSVGTLAAESSKKTSRILIAFYSYSGNTRAAAKQIQDACGGDLFEIKPLTAYPSKYNACVAQAKKEIRDGYTPPLADKADLTPYDIVFLGSPNWWGTMAPPVRSFIQKNDLAGKTIVPFFTHGGGGMQNCEADMKKYCEAARAGKILSAFVCSGRVVHQPVPSLKTWAEEAVKAAAAKK